MDSTTASAHYAQAETARDLALSKLPALLYYDQVPKGTKAKPRPDFETLPPDRQQPYRDQVGRILEWLSKLELEVAPRVDHAGVASQAAVSEHERHDRLVPVIREFMRGLMVLNRDLIPYEELAWRIIKADTQ